jgi:hypothetical protein
MDYDIPETKPPIGNIIDGRMRRTPTFAGDSRRTAWKYSGIMNMYFRVLAYRFRATRVRPY